MQIRQLLFVLFILLSFCKKQEDVPQIQAEPISANASYMGSPALEDFSTLYYIVTAAGGLKLREEPNLNSKTMGLIPEGDIVEYLEEAGEEFTVEGRTKRFYKINWQEKTGYAFGGFLDDGSEQSFGIIDPGKTKGYKILPNSKKVMSPNETKYYHQLTLNNPGSMSGIEKSCNHKYGGIYCYAIVYDSRTNKVVYSRTVDSGYWDSWINEKDILIRSDFGDEGTSWNGYTVFRFAENKVLLDVTVYKIFEMNDRGIDRSSEEDLIVYSKDSEIISLSCKKGKAVFGTKDSFHSNDVNVLKTMPCSSLSFPEKYDGLYFDLDGYPYKILSGNVIKKL